MEFEEDILEPVSPMGQYLNSSVLSLTILGVLESEIPIDDLQTLSLLGDSFLPINTRFSSIMVSPSIFLHMYYCHSLLTCMHATYFRCNYISNIRQMLLLLLVLDHMIMYAVTDPERKN